MGKGNFFKFIGVAITGILVGKFVYWALVERPKLKSNGRPDLSPPNNPTGLKDFI